jgi:hypothetical protein
LMLSKDQCPKCLLQEYDFFHLLRTC